MTSHGVNRTYVVRIHDTKNIGRRQVDLKKEIKWCAQKGQ